MPALLTSGCSHPYFAEPASVLTSSAKATSDAGIMSEADYIRVMHLWAETQSGEAMDNDDVDWLLAVAYRPGSPYQELHRMKDVSLAFVVCKPSSLPAGRVGDVFGFAKKLAALGPTDHDAGAFACFIMRNVVGAAAIPELEMLSHSPVDSISRHARVSILQIEHRPVPSSLSAGLA
jgi:hypothetical protein